MDERRDGKRVYVSAQDNIRSDWVSFQRQQSRAQKQTNDINIVMSIAVPGRSGRTTSLLVCMIYIYVERHMHSVVWSNRTFCMTLGQVCMFSPGSSRLSTFLHKTGRLDHLASLNCL